SSSPLFPSTTLFRSTAAAVRNPPLTRGDDRPRAPAAPLFRRRCLWRAGGAAAWCRRLVAGERLRLPARDGCCGGGCSVRAAACRSEEHTSELQSREN